MALFDTQLAMLANQASNALVSGKDPKRQGAGHPNIVPYQPFRRPISRSSSRSATTGSSPSWRRSSAIPEWADDPLSRPMPRGSRARAAGADDRRDHRRPSRRRMAGAAGSGGNPGRADQHDQPGAGRSAGGPSRVRIAAAAARWARCRWSARRSASTASAADAPAAAGAGRAWRIAAGVARRGSGVRRRPLKAARDRRLVVDRLSE